MFSYQSPHRMLWICFYREKKTTKTDYRKKQKNMKSLLHFYERLTDGEDYTKKDGTVVKNEWVTEEGAKGKVYAFCADTKYDESIIPHIEDADMIYHETTYLDNLA